MVQIPDHPMIREMEKTGTTNRQGTRRSRTGHKALARSAGVIARKAAAALEELSEAGRLAEETKTARELCGVLKDALAIERELRDETRGAAITVRFEGETEKASL